MSTQSNIKQALTMSGLLIQPHPGYDGWRTTRPGARPGEVLAFVHDVPDERKSFISVVAHHDGEEDEDGFEWGSDCYEIIVSHADGECEIDVAETDDSLAEAVENHMRNIAEN